MLLFIFFCIGIYTFSRGLKIYREIAILKSTPVLPIRNQEQEDKRLDQLNMWR